MYKSNIVFKKIAAFCLKYRAVIRISGDNPNSEIFFFQYNPTIQNFL